MNAALKTGWSPERRAAQAEAIKRWKPWEQSTGPKTAEGKKTASRNARTFGTYDRSAKRLAYVFSLQNQYRRLYNDLNKTGQLALFPLIWRARIAHERPVIHQHGLENSDHIHGEIDALIHALFATLMPPLQENPANELLDRTRHCEKAKPTKQSIKPPLDCFAMLAMTPEPKIMQKTGFFRWFEIDNPA